MPREVRVRSPDEWGAELQRLHRMARAAEKDLLHQGEWKAMVVALVDSLALLLIVSPAGEDEALAAARRRLESVHGQAAQRRASRQVF